MPAITTTNKLLIRLHDCTQYSPVPEVETHELQDQIHQPTKTPGGHHHQDVGNCFFLYAIKQKKHGGIYE